MKYKYRDCSGLTSIDIPGKVKTIGNCAFQDCGAVTAIVIPNSVLTIGDYAFYAEGNLHSVTIGTGVTSIGYHAFGDHQKTIWLPNTPPEGYMNAACYSSINYVSNRNYTFDYSYDYIVYRFLSSMFEVDGIKYVPISTSDRTCDAIDCVYNESVGKVKVGPTVAYKGVALSVKNIQPYTAYGNKYIEQFIMDNDGEIANSAFSGCTNLKTAIFDNVETELDEEKFEGLYLGKNISRLGHYSLYGCEALKNLTIADRETVLELGCCGKNALFVSCPLEKVYIGGGIRYDTRQEYGYSPFCRNTSIQSVVITDKETQIYDNEFYGCTSLQDVRIGEGVTDIGKYAFSGCSSLQTFAYGSQVQTIGEESFSDCSAMTEIVSRANTPPVCGNQALDDINKWECRLYVPVGTSPTYQQADQWKDFLFAEEGTGTVGENPGTQSALRCAKPTIAVENGKLAFSCATEDVRYVTDVRYKGGMSVEGNEADLTGKTTCHVVVYATKEGYLNSEVATADVELNIGTNSSQLKGDVNGDGKVDIVDVTTTIDIILKK